MQVYPAIDIKGGRVARTTNAALDVAYATDPAAVAERFVAGGARWLHVVDLDRAFATGRENDALVRRIAAITGVSVQLGGLLRGPDDIARALELGAARAVVACAAAADARVLDAIVACTDASRLAVAVDVRRGQAVIRGQTEPLAVTPEALVRRAVAVGVNAVIHRDLDRDGALAGTDVAAAARLSGLGAAVIVAGGIATPSHLVAARDAGLAGAIVGRALHEGVLTVEEAIACSA